MVFSHKLYIDTKQHVSNMADLNYQASIQEDGWYLAVAKPRCKTGHACITCEGETFEELKRDILDSVSDCLQTEGCNEAGIPKSPSVAVHFEEEILPGKYTQAAVTAERNCTKYQTKPNGVLKQAYEHETLEGLRALVKKAVRKAKPKGKKIVLVLEEILQ